MMDSTDLVLNEKRKKPSLIGGPLAGLASGTGINLAALPVQQILARGVLASGDRSTADYLKLVDELKRVLKTDPKLAVLSNVTYPHYSPPIKLAPDWFVKNISLPVRERMGMGGLTPETIRAGYAGVNPSGHAAVLAHELAHASGPVRHFIPSHIYRASGLAAGYLPIITGYRAAKGESLGSDIGQGIVSGGLTGAAAGSPMLLEEGRASLRGFQALKKLDPKLVSPADLVSSRKVLIKAWLTYLLKLAGGGAATGAMMGGIGHTVKARRKWFEEQKKREGQPVKAASYLGFRVGLMHGRAATRF